MRKRQKTYDNIESVESTIVISTDNQLIPRILSKCYLQMMQEFLPIEAWSVLRRVSSELDSWLKQYHKTTPFYEYKFYIYNEWTFKEDEHMMNRDYLNTYLLFGGTSQQLEHIDCPQVWYSMDPIKGCVIPGSQPRGPISLCYDIISKQFQNFMILCRSKNYDVLRSLLSSWISPKFFKFSDDQWMYVMREAIIYDDPEIVLMFRMNWPSNYFICHLFDQETTIDSGWITSWSAEDPLQPIINSGTSITILQMMDVFHAHAVRAWFDEN
jgi:hypothetical protein